MKKPIGPVAPPPDPGSVADFDLGTWRVRPALARMTRADRILALDEQTLLVLLILAERPPGGVNREELVVRVFGAAGGEGPRDKLRRCLSFLRRAFSEDGAVRILNAPGDCFVLEVGEPAPGRGLRPPASDALLENPPAIDNWLRRGKQRCLSIDEAADEFRKALRLQIAGLGGHRDNAPATFDQTDDGGFLGATAALVAVRVIAPLIPFARLAADIGFIGFDDAMQQSILLRVIGHRHANTMHQAPHCRAAHTDVARNLARTGRFLRVEHERND